MARRELVRVRPFSVIAALLLVVLSIGVSGSASADPGDGNDNGNGAEKSALAQQDNGSNGKSADSSASLKSQSGNAGNHSTGHPGTSGDVNEPQPLSNADLNTGGANGQCTGGVYCSTRDGSASANGNGGGKAVGRPLAAEVGKADNKNPQGQMPNARDDGNNGYECDGNNGIAKGNPAHTACELTQSVNPPPPVVRRPPANVAGVETVRPPADVAGVETIRPPADIAGVETVRPPANVAGVETIRPPANVAGVETIRPPAAVPPVAVPPAAVPAGVLPATGAPNLLGLLGGGGMGLLTLGGLTIWLHRRYRVIG